ncbi:MAG: ribonuclease activity regulator RraA [Paracoccaceae bacterium]
MTITKDILRPDPAIVAKLRDLGAATVAGTLAHLGIRQPHIQGPVSWLKGRAIAGPALTLLMMPKREDLYGEGEYLDPEKQLHRHVLYHTQPGDIVVVDARGDLTAGIFGEMMMTYFKGRGGIGMVIDGAVRDYPGQIELDMPMWIRGLTPNFHTQTGLMPFDFNCPIACGGVTVIPGDIIVADDDGAVCVPAAMGAQVIEHAGVHHAWEDFSKHMLLRGGSLQRYYPLSDDARGEYEDWRKSNPIKTKP